WVHVQLHQQKGMISLSPPTICNSADSSKPTCRQNRCCKNGSDHRFRFLRRPLAARLRLHD
ncbi:hypothetical protein YA42_18680, partial [Enterobacter hormaechei subsp. oharae]